MKNITILLVVLFVYSCDRHDINQEIAILPQNFKIVPSQVFIVNPLKDTTILLLSGSSIKIKELTFVNSNKEVVKQKISFTVFEFTSLAECLLNNLSTNSNGKIIETGGMFYTEAKLNNETLGYQNPLSVSYKNDKLPIIDRPGLYQGEIISDGLNWNLDTSKIRSELPGFILISNKDTLYSYGDGRFETILSLKNSYLFDLYFPGLANIDKEVVTVPTNIHVTSRFEFDACYLMVSNRAILATAKKNKSEFYFTELPKIESNDLIYVINIGKLKDEKIRIAKSKLLYDNKKQDYFIQINSQQVKIINTSEFINIATEIEMDLFK